MKRVLPLVLIVLAGLLARAIGLNYGLPFAYHDDEPIIINYALAYASGDLNPHVFNMSPFLSYVLFFLYACFYIIGKLFGVFLTTRDFAYLYLRDPTHFFLIARVLFGLLAGTASCAGIYFLGRRYFNRMTGLIAALLLAFNYLHVRDSHYAYFDIPLTLCVIVFFIRLYDLYIKARLRDYIAVGAILGIAAAVKYSGMLLGVALLFAFSVNFLSERNKARMTQLLKFITCLATATAVFFICNPFALIDAKTFLRDVTHLPFIPIPAHFHLNVSLLEGCGAGILIFAFAGALLNLFSRSPWRIALTLYAFVYYLVIARSSQPAERLVLPLVPAVMVYAAALIETISRPLVKTRHKLIAIGALIFFLSYPSLKRVVLSDYLFLQADTRIQSYAWIKKNLPKDSVIALDAIASWFPKLEKSKLQIQEILNAPAEAVFAKPKRSLQRKAELLLENPYHPETTFFLYYLKERPGADFLSAQPALEIDLKRIREKKIKYVVLSRMLIDTKYANFLQSIEQNSRLLVEFSPYVSQRDPFINKEAVLPPAAGFLLAELEGRKSFGPFIRIYELIYE